jgi:hypothetical protein
MSEFNEHFVSSETYDVLTEEFIRAINDCIENPNTLIGCRNCRALQIHKDIIDNFLFSQIDGCVSIIAKGGGWVEWFLCRHKSSLFFVFVGNNFGTKIVSARATNHDEILRHLKDVDNQGGVNVDGEIIPYDEVYNIDDDFDAGELDFKTTMARPK